MTQKMNKEEIEATGRSPLPGRLAVELAPKHPTGLRLSNPVMIASGTFGWDGYGRGLPEGLDFQSLGAVVAKTVTMHPREGNPEPRWFPTSWRQAWQDGECLYLNSIGLTNPGIKAALQEKAPVWAKWQVPIILSLAGETVQEFGQMAAMAEGAPGIAALELNLSCPNVDNGLFFGQSPEVTEATVAQVKASTSLPVIAKLGPAVTDILPIAQAAARGGADALTLTNTMPAMAIDIDTRKAVLGGITGGLSGPGLRPIALAMVYRSAQAVDIPIIGVGGVFTARDALEFLMAGASAVQIGSANLANFWAPLEVLDGLRSYLGEHGITDIHELIGVARRK